MHSPSPPKSGNLLSSSSTARGRNLFNNNSTNTMVTQNNNDSSPQADDQVSPELRAAAKKRAAISAVRAAMALHKTTNFESLPPQAQRVTRAMASDEAHFMEAIEELNRTNASYASEDFGSLNNTRRTLGGTARSTTTMMASTARPYSASRRFAQTKNEKRNNLSPSPASGGRQQRQKGQDFISGAFGDHHPSSQRGHATVQQQHQSPDSTYRGGATGMFISPTSALNNNNNNNGNTHNSHNNNNNNNNRPQSAGNLSNRRIAALGLRSPPGSRGRGQSPAKHLGSANHQLWSPRRPPQVVPTSMNLHQVINEIKLRIPAMRRAIAATPAQTTDLKLLGDNMSRIFTLIDAKNVSEVSLQEISAFGKRIGGNTQQLFRIAEVRARLHHRFPTVYPSPLIIEAEEYERQQQQQMLDGTALFLEATNNFNMSLTAPKSAMTPQQQPMMNAAGETSSSQQQQPLSLANSFHIPNNSNVMIAASSNPTPPTKMSSSMTPKTSVVKVRTPNPYEDPITREVFIDAIISPWSNKWASQAPAAVSRSSTGPMRRRNNSSATINSSSHPTSNTSPSSRAGSEGRTSTATPTTASSALRKKVIKSSSFQRNSNNDASNSPITATTSAPNGQPDITISNSTSTFQPASPATSSSTPVTRAKKSANNNLQRTSSSVSNTTTGASSDNGSSADPSFGSNPFGANNNNNNNNNTTNPPHLVGGGRSRIPTDPEQRASFFRVVRIVDPNNSGFITLDALTRACPRTSAIEAIVPSQFSTKSFFFKHDIDQDGRLTIEEFADMMKESFVPEHTNLSTMLRNLEEMEASEQSSAGDRLTKAKALLEAAEEKKKEIDFTYKGRRVNWNKNDMKSKMKQVAGTSSKMATSGSTGAKRH